MKRCRVIPLQVPLLICSGYVLVSALVSYILESEIIALSAVPAAILAAVCILSWSAFQRALNRRIDELVAATERVAAGEQVDESLLRDFTELQKLSEAFQRMSQQITSSTAELRSANDRMKAEIAERKTVEEALRNSERRFRSIWENSLEPLRLTDEKGVVVSANPAYCVLMERRLEQILDRPYTEVYEPGSAEHKLARYTRCFKSRTLERYQTKKVSLRSGRTLDVEVSYSFIDMESERPLLLGVFRDVTERIAVLDKLKNAKEFSENLIKTATMMIIGVDELDRITIFNEAAEKVSGFTKAEVQGRKWSELVRADNSFLEENQDDAYRHNFEARLVTKNLQERLIAWQSNPLIENGEAVGTIFFGTDVTNHKKEEEHRMALERKLLEAQKLESLGVLAGGIAHDFNNLLAAILGNANLAQLRVPASEIKLTGYLKSIEKASMRAADLCKQMLAYSGKGRFAMHVLDVNEVVRETLELLEVSITKKAALRVELRHGVPPVKADATQLRQVIMNLVINASEAIGDTSGTIRVRTGVINAGPDFFAKSYSPAELSPGEYVFVEVTDTGCGMTEETLKRIFDPFFTTKFTGRGLGLAAVLGIVRGHRGALKIESEAGKGSAFKFLLPMADAPISTETNPGTDLLEKYKGEGNILIIDDDPSVRAVMARMAEAVGFTVLQAVDGRHGVEVFKENEKSLRAVILDMTMPNVDGREALQQLRAIRKDLRVLMVSGFSESGNTSFFTRNGPDAFLQKPFTADELTGKLKTILTARKLDSNGSNGSSGLGVPCF
ncbi:MAG TPA: PAS domain S-box protein [Verrucomicrobiae bacterium]